MLVGSRDGVAKGGFFLDFHVGSKKVQSAAGNRVQIWPEWVSKSAKGHCFWIVFADGSTEHQDLAGPLIT